jgi:hypothetical protein
MQIIWKSLNNFWEKDNVRRLLHLISKHTLKLWYQ